MSDKGSEFSGKNEGLCAILPKEKDCVDINFDFCDNHGIHNTFGDGLKFVENPLKYNKFLYKCRHRIRYQKKEPLVTIIKYLNNSASFFKKSPKRTKHYEAFKSTWK